LHAFLHTGLEEARGCTFYAYLPGGIYPEEKMHRYLCLKKRSYPQLERPKHRRDNRVNKSPFNQS
jgi:hypothetical protein